MMSMHLREISLVYMLKIYPYMSDKVEDSNLGVVDKFDHMQLNQQSYYTQFTVTLRFSHNS